MKINNIISGENQTKNLLNSEYEKDVAEEILNAGKKIEQEIIGWTIKKKKEKK